MADIFNWYDDLLQSRYQPQTTPMSPVQPEQPLVQYQNGQPQPYQRTQADIDQAYNTLRDVTGVGSMQQGFREAQQGNYLPAAGYGALGATQMASTFAPPLVRGLRAAVETPAAADALTTLRGVMSDESGALRLPQRQRMMLPPVPEGPAPAGATATEPALEAAAPMMGHNRPPALGFPQAKFPEYAERYPPLGAPVTEIDKTSGKEYLAKGWTPEMVAFDKERARIVKDMKKGYEGYFDVSQREHVDPANYPANVDTTTIVPGPRAKTTVEQEMATVGSDDARARLQAAYARGDAMPNTADWYAVKQVEDQFIKEYGVEEGRKQFQDKFATSMAATTGGANPEANFLMAMYGNYLRNQPNAVYPEGGYEMPYPIGGRFATGNMAQHQKIFDQGGFPALGAANPKRHNFSQNFTGNAGAATMDEQMTSGMTPGINMPPTGRYGIYERVLAEEAEKARVDPRRFQEVAWAGFKNMKDPRYTSGVPMMQTINDSIERTHRLTGLPKEEIVRRGLVRGEIPMYGLLGAIGLGAAANQYEPGT